MPGQHVLRTGDRVLVGGALITVDQDFAESLEAGDTVIGLAQNSLLLRIPATVEKLAADAVTQCVDAF